MGGAASMSAWPACIGVHVAGFATGGVDTDQGVVTCESLPAAREAVCDEVLVTSAIAAAPATMTTTAPAIVCFRVGISRAPSRLEARGQVVAGSNRPRP